MDINPVGREGKTDSGGCYPGLEAAGINGVLRDQLDQLVRIVLDLYLELLGRRNTNRRDGKDRQN